MNSCNIKVSGIEFPIEKVTEAVKQKRLLSIEIELSLRCNFRCPYCYVPDKAVLDNELSLDEILSVVTQARDLGAEKIILLGGEPMLYPYLFEVIEFVRAQNMSVEMFTNGFGITEGMAQKLSAYNVNVVLKMNTFDESVQDELSGHKGAYTIIHDAFRNLRAAGYPSRGSFMAVSTIICAQNIGELRDIWRWLRDQNIEPYFEMITPQGNASDNEWLNVGVDQIEDLFRDIERIDREEYGIVWSAQPPLVGNKCLRHLFSCLVTSRGDVNPCVGIPFSVGSIRKQSLKSIIEDSEVIQNLRDHSNTIKGPCSTCEKSEFCYGCRGAAYNLTGDYLASDPLCWLNKDRQEEIDFLPLPVDEYIPHTDGLKLVETLVSVSEREASAIARVDKDMLFVDDKGVLDSLAYIEMVAQSIAAMDGFAKRNQTKKMEGFLLGIKNFEVYCRARAGDVLEINVHKDAKYGDFGIVSGSVKCGEKILARGEIKVYAV